MDTTNCHGVCLTFEALWRDMRSWSPALTSTTVDPEQPPVHSITPSSCSISMEWNQTCAASGQLPSNPHNARVLIRSFEAHEGHPVFSVSFSPSGDRLLIVTGGSVPKIYNRDGIVQGQFPRGDMYIRDMKNTKGIRHQCFYWLIGFVGHVCGCCQGQWHPTDKAVALTSSEDGTVRIWDTYELEQKTVIKPNLRKASKQRSSSHDHCHITFNNDICKAHLPMRFHRRDPIVQHMTANCQQPCRIWWNCWIE